MFESIFGISDPKTVSFTYLGISAAWYLLVILLYRYLEKRADRAPTGPFDEPMPEDPYLLAYLYDADFIGHLVVFNLLWRGILVPSKSNEGLHLAKQLSAEQKAELPEVEHWALKHFFRKSQYQKAGRLIRNQIWRGKIAHHYSAEIHALVEKKIAARKERKLWDTRKILMAALGGVVLIGMFGFGIAEYKILHVGLWAGFLVMLHRSRTVGMNHLTRRGELQVAEWARQTLVRASTGDEYLDETDLSRFFLFGRLEWLRHHDAQMADLIERAMEKDGRLFSAQ